MSLLLLIGSSKFVGRQPMTLTLFSLMGFISHSDRPLSVLITPVIICLRPDDPIRLHAPCGRGLCCRSQAQTHSLVQWHLWAAIQPGIILMYPSEMEVCFGFAGRVHIGYLRAPGWFNKCLLSDNSRCLSLKPEALKGKETLG